MKYDDKLTTTIDVCAGSTSPNPAVLFFFSFNRRLLHVRRHGLAPPFPLLPASFRGFLRHQIQRRDAPLVLRRQPPAPKLAISSWRYLAVQLSGVRPLRLDVGAGLPLQNFTASGQPLSATKGVNDVVDGPLATENVESKPALAGLVGDLGEAINSLGLAAVPPMDFF